MKNANINVRIEDSLFKEVKEYELDISEVVRAALISEIEKKRVDRIMRALVKASEAVKKMKVKQIVADVREMRETR